jgi:dTDP-glucose pyrophosphorylase
MIKKVIISAAGRGTRMRWLTKFKPKHLIYIRKKPFIFYLLENLKRAGYKEFIVVVGYKSKPLVKFLKGYDKNIKIVDQFKVLGKTKYGTACAIKCVEKLIGNENFLAVYGDNLYSPTDLVAFNINDKFNYVAGFLHKHPERYGVLITRNSFLVKIIEKPKKFVGNIINCGLYKFTPEIFKAIRKIKKSSRGEYELTDAISILARKNKVKVKILKGYWLDFGKPSDIPKLSKFIEKEFKTLK